MGGISKLNVIGMVRERGGREGGGGKEREKEGERYIQGLRIACCVYYGNLRLYNTCGIKWLVCDHIGIIKINRVTCHTSYKSNFYHPAPMLDQSPIAMYSLCQVKHCKL